MKKKNDNKCKIFKIGLEFGVFDGKKVKVF